MNEPFICNRRQVMRLAPVTRIDRAKSIRLASRTRLLLGSVCLAALSGIPTTVRADSPDTTQALPTQPSSPATAPVDANLAALKNLSLEELMNVPVTSVSKRESTVGQSPAAIFVISQDDIHRSGATSIPEALRMAPGLEVAQIDSDSWAISARGFNSQDANKLLVLMDGRSVYTPLFGGVFWDAQNTMMQDLDRIEVIRGPAGTLWGENAVNGVINVISKDAKDTQGLLVSGGGGSLDRAFGDVRYGWKISDDTYVRAYVQHFERDQSLLPNGTQGHDASQMSQGGFRLDSQPTSADHFTFHGDLYGGYENNLGTADTELSGGNIVGLWTHDMGPDGDLKLQMYYDHSHHNMLPFAEQRDTGDVDFQHHVHFEPHQDFTWGLGYRVTSDQTVGNTAHTVGSTITFFDPDHRATTIISAFAQYEIELIENRLRLTLGSKFEHNDFSGFNVQPNARLLWNINKKQSAWASVSRAVRTPTRLDEDVRITEEVAPGNNFTLLHGNPHFQPETVLAYELGYRVEPIKTLSFDVATYYNVYHDLQSINNATSAATLPWVFSNLAHGDTYGVEVGSTFKAADWWTVRAAYTYLQVQTGATDGNIPVGQNTAITHTPLIATGDPHNQVYVRSSMDFPHHVQLDLSARYVEQLSNFAIPSYISMDARLSWQPTEHIEVSVVGQNLLDNQHPEFQGNYSTAGTRHEIPRSVYGMLTYRW
jgi:iron complex outermembrane receptor protein